MLSLWQEIADQFYPERGEFTVSRSAGDEFASHLMTGLPMQVRRDLGDQISVMLRSDKWFDVEPDEDLREDHAVRMWLSDRARIMRNVFEYRGSGFDRATSEADHDFATFGQAVLKIELDRRDNMVLFRCFHLRDVAWAEDYRRAINEIHHNWKPTARTLGTLFPKTIHPSVAAAIEKEPHREIMCRHVIVPIEDYDLARKKGAAEWRYASVYVDCENQTILEETPLEDHPYVIPRWKTLGSPYAHSPCVMAALPDARLLQQMTLTMLEAGEKAVNPPLVAAQEVVRSDINVYPGGITWVDAEYDERLGDALRPLSQDRSGLGFGMDMLDRMASLLREGFYLNKLSLHTSGPDPTAAEVRTRTREYVRAALPLFRPLGTEYNEALCEKTWNLMMRNGGFGNLREEMPEVLRGREVRFRFTSPLQEAEGRENAAAFQELATLLGLASKVDPKVVMEVDVRKSFRDAAIAISPDPDWVVPMEVSDEARHQAAQQEHVQNLAMGVQQGLGLAKGVAETAQSFQATGVL